MEPNRLYFFTATILNWKHLLINDKFKQIVLEEIKNQVNKGSLKVYGFVIMPNHIHLIISIPSPNLPQDVQRDMLKWISRSLIKELKENHIDWLNEFLVKTSDRQFQIWERNSLAIEIYSRDVIFQKLEYIHNNPVKEKWSLARFPEEYHFSSAGYYYDQRTSWDFLTNILD